MVVLIRKLLPAGPHQRSAVSETWGPLQFLLPQQPALIMSDSSDKKGKAPKRNEDESATPPDSGKGSPHPSRPLLVPIQAPST
jgi:hypothetical protein